MSNEMFKAGDLVVCINSGLIDGNHMDDLLNEGTTYVVEHDQYESDNVQIARLGGFLPVRFELVQRVEAGPRTL